MRGRGWPLSLGRVGHASCLCKAPPTTSPLPTAPVDLRAHEALSSEAIWVLAPALITAPSGHLLGF